MKLDFSTAIRDLNGKPIQEGETIITLGSVCSNALLALHPDEQTLPGEVKVRRFQLAVKIYNGGEQDVSVEELSILKTMVGKHYLPIVVGRVYEIIEGAKVPASE